MKVGIVGGGVVGLATGWYLTRAGADVTIIERSACGSGASAGNTGWITPGLSTPIPAPGVMRQAVRWMARPDSPFLIRPRASWPFARWCWQFWRSSFEGPYREGLSALLALNEPTFRLYDELRESGVDFELHDTGLLVVAEDEEHLAEYQALFRELGALGYRDGVALLTGEELVGVEPALSRGLAGGIQLLAERHVRPETLTAGLVSDLRTRGATISEHTEVESLRPRQGRWALDTSSGAIELDKVVVAAGAWSAHVLKGLRIRLPLEAAKGYSLTGAGSGVAPTHALYLADAKVACSSFDGGLRIAGTLELAGLDLSLNARRLAALRNAASRYLASWEPAEVQIEWAGLRPLAPDGLPYIGSVPHHAGLYVATGHGMLGMTLAPATGAFLASLVLEDRLPAELRPFRLDRGRVTRSKAAPG